MKKTFCDRCGKDIEANNRDQVTVMLSQEHNFCNIICAVEWVVANLDKKGWK